MLGDIAHGGDRWEAKAKSVRRKAGNWQRATGDGVCSGWVNRQELGLIILVFFFVFFLPVFIGQCIMIIWNAGFHFHAGEV